MMTDAIDWLLEFITENWSESVPVIRETLEDSGAPPEILAHLDKLYDETT